MRIALLNVKYSPNLGDGAIAQCLEEQLSSTLTHAQVFSVDISGRDHFGSSRDSIVGANFRVARFTGVLPTRLRSILQSRILPTAVSAKYGRAWHAALRDCDALIIGGGHLFQDVDHYFPTRLLVATRQANRRIPVFIYGVGVAKHWTPRGAELVARTLQHGNIEHVYVRDPESRQNWIETFGRSQPQVVYDPALLSRDVFGPTRTPLKQHRIISIGLSDPSDLRMHSQNPDSIVEVSPDLCSNIVGELTRRGFYVALFTNGADHDYLEHIAGTISRNGKRRKVHVLPRATTPVELAHQIAGSDLVMSNRLHASVIAYSYGVPHIGLAADKKVQSFFEYTCQQERLITPSCSSPDEIISRMMKALETGVCPTTRAGILAGVKSQISRFSKVLVQSVENARADFHCH